MFGSTALSVPQLRLVLDTVLLAQNAGHTVIGLVLNNPGRRRVDIDLIGADGQNIEEFSTTLGMQDDDPALTHPSLAA